MVNWWWWLINWISTIQWYIIRTLLHDCTSITWQWYYAAAIQLARSPALTTRDTAAAAANCIRFNWMMMMMNVESFICRLFKGRPSIIQLIKYYCSPPMMKSLNCIEYFIVAAAITESTVYSIRWGSQYVRIGCCCCCWRKTTGSISRFFASNMNSSWMPF